MKVRTSHTDMRQYLSDVRELDTTGDKNLLITGAKAAYCGGGWWNITGYAQAKGLYGVPVDAEAIVERIRYNKPCGEAYPKEHVPF